MHILTNAAKTIQVNSGYPERGRESGLTIDIQKLSVSPNGCKDGYGKNALDMKWIPASYYSKKLEAILEEKDSKN